MAPVNASLLVAEQLALQERLRQSRAVNLDERLFLAGGVVVKSLRDHLLARAAFPGDEHRGSRGRHLADHLEDLLHLGALADDAGELASALQLLLHGAVLKGQLPVGKRALDHEGEAVQVHRLGEEIVGAVVHGLDGAFDGAMPREDDHRHRGVLGGDVAQELFPREVRHLEVSDHEVDVALADRLPGLLAVRGGDHVVAVENERLAKPLADVLFIVSHKDGELHCASPL